MSGDGITKGENGAYAGISMWAVMVHWADFIQSMEGLPNPKAEKG